MRQHSLNGSSIFPYIWPENQFIAIGQAGDNYLSLSPEELGKCKEINTIKICKDNEPVRTISRFTPCEIQLAVNRSKIDFSKIKVIKLATTFWTRSLAPNEWLFSANDKQQLLTSCKRLSDRILIIEGAGLLRLPQGCSAKPIM